MAGTHVLMPESAAMWRYQRKALGKDEAQGTEGQALKVSVSRPVKE